MEYRVTMEAIAWPESRVATREPQRTVELPTDNDLMSRVREGEVSKLAVLFERHHRTLFNFFLRLTGKREFSEDLVQDVFFRILKHRATYQPGSQFTAWMFQIARNAYIDQGRRKRIEIAAWPGEDGDRAFEPAASEPGPEAQLAQSQDVALLRRALMSLPEDRRELLLLARFEQLSYDQIGKLLGCEAGTIKVRVFRAVKELGRRYAEMAGARAS